MIPPVSRRIFAAFLFIGFLGLLDCRASDNRSLAEILIGEWAGDLRLPNGLQLHDVERFKRDGFAAGRIITYYRDHTVKASTSYTFSWRIDGKILVAQGYIRVPRRDNQPDSTRDEILRLDEHELVIRDLDENLVVTYHRIN